jgi:hypothetical protein
VIQDQRHHNGIPQGAVPPPVVTFEVTLLGKPGALVETTCPSVVGPHFEGHFVASTVACPVDRCGQQDATESDAPIPLKDRHPEMGETTLFVDKDATNDVPVHLGDGP